MSKEEFIELRTNYREQRKYLKQMEIRIESKSNEIEELSNRIKALKKECSKIEIKIENAKEEKEKENIKGKFKNQIKKKIKKFNEERDMVMEGKKKGEIKKENFLKKRFFFD